MFSRREDEASGEAPRAMAAAAEVGARSTSSASEVEAGDAIAGTSELSHAIGASETLASLGGGETDVSPEVPVQVILQDIASVARGATQGARESWAPSMDLLLERKGTQLKLLREYGSANRGAAAGAAATTTDETPPALDGMVDAATTGTDASSGINTDVFADRIMARARRSGTARAARRGAAAGAAATDETPPELGDMVDAATTGTDASSGINTDVFRERIMARARRQGTARAARRGTAAGAAATTTDETPPDLDEVAGSALTGAHAVRGTNRDILDERIELRGRSGASKRLRAAVAGGTTNVPRAVDYDFTEVDEDPDTYDFTEE